MFAEFIEHLTEAARGAENVKDAEHKLQDAIETVFPNKPWWKTTKVKIFNELGPSRRSVKEVIAMIAYDIFPQNKIEFPIIK